MSEIVINLNKIRKKYGSRTILKDFSLEISRGEFVALTGSSGSGKSTILNIIGLLETFDDGSYQLLDQKSPGINSRQATLVRRQKINYLFQTFALVAKLTVRQNLQLAMQFTDFSRREMALKIKEALTEVGLDQLEDAVVATLSVGEKQRVAVARAFLKPGEIVLADEPTGSLDPKLATQVFELIKQLRDKHQKTIVMVTHDLELAQKADRNIVLQKIIN